MCKYFYREGWCANKTVQGLECIGKDKCDLFLGKGGKEREGCGYDNWYGLYCAKYQRFYCAGKGNCETMEDYMRSFARSQRGEFDEVRNRT